MSNKNTNIHYSGIGGQAVLEGVMMKNKDDYAIAIRKSDGDIDVDVEVYHSILHGHKIKQVPFLRGVFNFIDSLVLGMKAINHSSEFYEDETMEPTKLDNMLDKATKGKSDSVLIAITTIISIVIAIGLFILLPYFISAKLVEFIRNDSLLAIIEGAVRIIIFLAYIIGISLMKDIHRLYQYHGAEHKCINCIEKGKVLTVKNVKKSSRIHRRCGTSFLFLVILISVVLFFFIRVTNPVYRVLVRLALVPVIAGISYELIRLAGKSDSLFVRIISAPGMWLQHATTKEPDESMIEVAIKSVEAVFDWKGFLISEFGYTMEEVDSFFEKEQMGSDEISDTMISDEAAQMTETSSEESV